MVMAEVVVGVVAMVQLCEPERFRFQRWLRRRYQFLFSFVLSQRFVHLHPTRQRGSLM